MASNTYLCISEKPTAAKRLAEALDEDGEPEKLPTLRTFSKVPIWECHRTNKRIIVIPALGHLYSTVEDSTGGWHYPAFSYKWVPTHEAQSKSKSRQFIAAFKKFSAEADEFIVATDYDLEGEVIGATIAKFACGQEDLSTVKRMKFSSLTKEEIVGSFESLSPSIDLRLADAGFTRHEIDWLYGINLTRALTLAIKHSTGRYKLISTGRVQGPTLQFVADREKAIQTFVPIPRWVVEAQIELEDERIDLEYHKRYISKLKEADQIIKETKEREGIVKKIGGRKLTRKPPSPFNLGGLQSEAYRQFGYSPSRTLRIAEGLYLRALISYPRTGSQQFPEKIDHRKILQDIAKMKKYKARVAKLLAKPSLKPTTGRKKDPAHPPIHPTGKKPEKRLKKEEQNILQLIICRYLAIFAPPAIKKSLRLDLDFNGHIFYLRGMRILKKGWLTFYEPFGKTDEVELPPLEKGDKVMMGAVNHRQSYTHPPSRYNPNSLLKKMEKEEIGTKATRSSIIDKLYSRGYIEDESMNTTDLGFAVIDTLEKYSPEIISVEMTRNLERAMENITAGDQSREEVLLSSIRELKDILERFYSKEKVIGITLQEQVQNLRRRQRILGKCPVCKEGELIIMRSTRTKKRFVGCTGFFKKICTWSAPIPQRGKASPAKKNCKHCDYPLITIKRRGKRPYTLCPNWLDCPGTPKEFIEAYEENKSKGLDDAIDKEE